MGIYTRGGDGGETGLFGGDRVSKGDPRIGTYGDVDELNSMLGWCAAVAGPQDAERLQHVQALLFTLGSFLATPPEASEKIRSMLPPFPEGSSAALEAQIDQWEEQTGALKAFILPGGCELAARLHVARCVCRRAERSLADFANSENAGIDLAHLEFLNRLSDWLFAFARAANHAEGTNDVPWVAPS
ncbi:MAG: cob(I)yrinic acid a,c-diamide adenosyltransferase [Planctomycetes bacterium]|nr:cob(I)yrinic acid a,c-diamide adenosyltransferase [Planctomycetota bacterium]MCP4770028.1 cob(I)yrinic acid a,c-diamide adenosyltransferase [Planctomycetota bacterium]MCP4859868.1 cob(I)yrinic acid a,c-diamide adenosyltransferase [Planctomycetota bacterium]